MKIPLFSSSSLVAKSFHPMYDTYKIANAEMWYEYSIECANQLKVSKKSLWYLYNQFGNYYKYCQEKYSYCEQTNYSEAYNRNEKDYEVIYNYANGAFFSLIDKIESIEVDLKAANKLTLRQQIYLFRIYFLVGNHYYIQADNFFQIHGNIEKDQLFLAIKYYDKAIKIAETKNYFFEIFENDEL